MCWKGAISPKNVFCWKRRSANRTARSVSSTAINKVVLHPGKVAHMMMIEFGLY
ncbi:hypothetical protein KCP75_14300 [Salmonella enterica subsp. enterica]|nr:hypothetical protein KCP75_14300 [Salmonella enterica subsp. enterica]